MKTLKGFLAVKLALLDLGLNFWVKIFVSLLFLANSIIKITFDNSHKKSYMRLKIILLFSIVAIGNSAISQDLNFSQRRSPYSYIYKLSNKQVLKIYKKSKIPADINLFNNLVDSFPAVKSIPKELFVGHYLIAKASYNKLELSVHSQNNVEPLVVNNGNDFSMIILSKGILIENAVVKVDGRKIKFDPKSNTYRISKGHPNGILTIESGGHTSVFQLEKEFNNTRLTLALRQKPVYYLWVPIRLIVGSPYDLYKTIASGYPRGLFYYAWKPFGDVYKSIDRFYPYGWVATVSDFTISIIEGEPEPRMQKLWEFFNHAFRDKEGFILTNQPKYRPGDTLHFKAFVADYKGKLNGKEKLDFKLNHKKISTLSPYRPGFYKSFIVLSDTLNLKVDRTQSIALINSKGSSINSSFLLEDYELKNSSFSASLLRKTHKKGEGNEVNCAVKDANGNYIADAKVNLSITTDRVFSCFDRFVFIPDTLWKYSGGLNDFDITNINIPDSIFPNAALSYKVKLKLTGENNEIKTFDLSGTFDATRYSIKVESHGADSLVAKYFIESREQNSTGTIVIDNRDSVSCTFPYFFAPTISEKTYEFLGKGTSFRYVVPNISNIAVAASRTKDSLILNISNPRRLPVNYFIYKGKSEIRRGNIGADIKIAKKFKSKQTCSVFISYPWAGELIEESYIVPLGRNDINVTISSPTNVVPGQVVDFKIAVNDSEGNPIPNADVTSWAYSSKFDKSSLPSFPNFNEKLPNPRIQRNKFFINEVKSITRNDKLNYALWGKKLGLDTIEFYKFLYPKNGIYVGSFNGKTDRPIISPFIHRNGEKVPIQQINLNGWPVYFGIENSGRPYAFNALISNNIEFITKDAVYSFKNVEVPASQKTILNFDIDNPSHQLNKRKKNKYDLRKQISDANRNILRVEPTRSVFFVKQFNNYFIPQSLSFRNTIYIAPIRSGNLEFVSPNGSYNFDFESGYTYSLDRIFIKMKSVAPFSKNFIKNSGNELDWTFKDVPLTVKDAQMHITPKISAFDELFTGTHQVESGFSSLVLENSPKVKRSPVTIVLINQKNNKIVYCNRFETLLNKPIRFGASGYYSVIVTYSKDETYLFDSLYLRNGGRTHIIFEYNRLGGIDAKQFDLAQLGKLPINPKGMINAINTYTPKLDNVKNKIEREATYNQSSNIVAGIVTSVDEGPLPGVSVVVVGTTVGVVTDINGYFTLRIPSYATKLGFSFIGFKYLEIPIPTTESIEVEMEPDALALEEVIVTAYGTQSKSNLSYSSSSVKGVVAGVQVSGIQIRGTSSIQSSSTPLYVINGVVVSADEAAKYDPKLFSSVNVLKGEQATSLYGSRAQSGVVVITTKGGAKLNVTNALKDSVYLAALEGSSSLRDNFVNYAFWKPSLTTDAKGIASFRAKLPDDITTWNTFAVAVTPALRTASAQSYLKAFKPLMASLSVPRFLVEGDSIFVRGRVTSYIDQKQNVSRSFKVFDAETLFPEVSMDRLIVDSLMIVAAPADSITLEYMAHFAASQSDGERRTIPINRQGTREVYGTFALLDTDTTLFLPDTLIRGKVKIYASAGRYDIFKKLSESIISYKYLCNEQAASMLLAHLVLRKIDKLDGKKYAEEKEIRKLVKKLCESNTSNGLWGWWKGSEDQLWISTHVLKALTRAKQEGYEVPLSFSAISDRLKQLLSSQYGYTNTLETAEIINSIDPTLDLHEHILKAEEFIKKTKDTTLQTSIKLNSLKMKLGLIKTIPDSLIKKANESFGGGMYWGELTYWPQEHPIVLTAQMYEAIKCDTLNLRLLPKIRKFFFYQLSNDLHMNTFSKIQLLDAISDDILKYSLGKPPVVKISSRDETIQVKDFPFSKEFEFGTKTTISKQGGSPVFFTAYSEYHNQNPLKVDDFFAVRSYFMEPNNELRAGKATSLWVELRVKKASPYTMVEVPIPAGCSYDDKQNKGLSEAHREKFKDHVSIFYNRLLPGTYLIEIKIVPRFTGKFNLNPARAELMYFPTNFGREGMKKVLVK
jgi:TonB-dependent SusC/RagA subfamily outer membrane receptor